MLRGLKQCFQYRDYPNRGYEIYILPTRVLPDVYTNRNDSPESKIVQLLLTKYFT